MAEYRTKKKKALEEQYPTASVITVKTDDSGMPLGLYKESEPLDLVAPETSNIPKEQRLSSKAALGIQYWLLGVPWKDAAKRCGMSLSGLKAARFSEAGRDLVGQHYVAVTEWTRNLHTAAIKTVADELQHMDVGVRLKSAELLLRHVNFGKSDTEASKIANASDIAKTIVEQLNVQININTSKDEADAISKRLISVHSDSDSIGS